MSLEMSEPVAVVSGGTRGIGYALAQALLDQGAKVFICGRQQTSLDRALETMGAGRAERAAGIAADVGDPQDCSRPIEAALERFGRLDILINNAGVGHVYKPVDQILPEVWDRTIQSNLSAMFYCCRGGDSAHAQGSRGYIFNISRSCGCPGTAPITPPKAGVSAFTETLLKEVRYDGIRVSEIVIGSVSTEERGYEDWKLAVEDVVELAAGFLEAAAAGVGRPG